MNQKLPLETIDRLLDLRAKLDRISQISFSFSTINKQYPISSITPDDAELIIEKYEGLLEETKRLA